MTRQACTFWVLVNGEFHKQYNSFCLDRQEAIAQMQEIYLESDEIDVRLFQFC